jgi:tetratricopeptide (TPR) repeat protein
MNIRPGSFRYLLFCLCAVITPLISAGAGEPQWVEVRSPHFSVVTDAGEKRGRETAMKFEQMRAVFGAMMAKAKVNLPVPLQIVAFRNTKEFRQFAPLWHGKATQLAGLFQSGLDRNFILLDMSVEDPWIVVFHEYAHELMNGNLTGETQPWFEEGFAEYFSTIEVDKKQAKLGLRVPPGDLDALQQYGMMKVSDLFRVQHNSQAYNEGDRRSIFYAESWLIVHYLYDTQQILKIGAYFDAIDRRLSVEDAILKGFGITAAQFDKELRKYMSTGRIRYMTIPTPAGIETTGYLVTPMSLVDAEAVTADMHLHSLDYQDKAVKEFEEVLAMQPNHEAALRGLGYAALRKRDFEHAGDYFRKAMQADSKDPRAFYYSALLVNQEDAMTRDPDKLASMKSDLTKSIALDPNFADAYALLAYAHMASGERDEAIASMKRALELNPRNEQYLFNLSQMYVAMGKTDEATAILRPLTNGASPEVAARAREAMVQIDKMQVVLHAMADHPARGPVQTAAPESATDSKIVTTESGGEVRPIPSVGPPKFLKGKLVDVDCSAPPAAVLIVVSGGKTWKMKVADSRHVILIGADDFSCSWKNQKVALNYREVSEGEGSVMTVEIQ